MSLDRSLLTKRLYEKVAAARNIEEASASAQGCCTFRECLAWRIGALVEIIDEMDRGEFDA